MMNASNPEFFHEQPDSSNYAAYTEALEEPIGSSSLWQRTKRGIEGGILFAQVTPMNEAARFGAAGAAIASGASPLTTAAVYGGATLAIEASAAYAAASWLDTDRSKNAIDWFNDKLKKRGIPTDTEFSPVTKAGIAFVGGTAIVQAVKHRENPERTKDQNRSYGLRAAAALAGVCGVQGYFVARGIDAPGPETIGGALIAVGGAAGLAKWTKKRLSKESTLGSEPIQDEASSI